jgi:hypothetical protein
VWAFVLLVVYGTLGWLGTGVTFFLCSRLPGEEPSCWLTNTGPVGRTYRYDRSSIVAVEVEKRAGTRAHPLPSFCLALVDPRGDERDIGCFERPEQAAAERDRLRRYLADSTRTLYRSETRASWIPYVMLTFAVAQFLAGAAVALAHAGRLRIRIDDANELEVIWTLFGIRRGKRHTHALDLVADARLQPGPVYTWLYRHPAPGARLAIALHGLRSAPATPYLPHVAALRRGVAELRELLGVASGEAGASD